MVKLTKLNREHSEDLGEFPSIFADAIVSYLRKNEDAIVVACTLTQPDESLWSTIWQRLMDHLKRDDWLAFYLNGLFDDVVVGQWFDKSLAAARTVGAPASFISYDWRLAPYGKGDRCVLDITFTGILPPSCVPWSAEVCQNGPWPHGCDMAFARWSDDTITASGSARPQFGTTRMPGWCFEGALLWLCMIEETMGCFVGLRDSEMLDDLERAIGDVSLLSKLDL